MRELVYYVGVSLDGFIADAEGDWSAFPQEPATLEALFDRYPETCPVQAREVMGVDAPNRRFDTVLMGRRTHQPAVDLGLRQSAYPHLRQVVVSHHEPGGGVAAVSGDVAAWVAGLKQQPGRDIWLCGGGDLAGQLVDLVDEVQLKVYPVALGRGVGLFGTAPARRGLRLASSEQLPGGVLLNSYRAV